MRKRLNETTVEASARNWRLRGAVAALGLAALLASGGNARAQDAYCVPCVDRRWDSIGQQLVDQAEALKLTREILREEEELGSPSEIAEARQSVEVELEQWNQILKTAQVLGEHSYNGYLARNLAGIETSYDEARAELRRKTEQLARLRNATDEQRARIYADLAGTEREEFEMAGNMALDAALNAMKAASVHAKAEIEVLRGGAAGDADHADRIRQLDRVVDLADGAEFGKAGWELASEQQLRAATSYLQLPVEAAAVAWGGPALVAAAILVGPITNLVFDAALLGLNQIQQEEAENRRKTIDDLEFHWEFEIARLGARVENLRLESEVASHTIERQAAFEQQRSRIQDPLAPAEFAP